MICLKLDNAGDFSESGVTAEGGEDAFLFEGEHAVRNGSAFDFVGVDVGDITADEGLDVFGNDELFHDDDTTIIAEGVIFGNDRVV